jgi:hypothetical protein
MDGGGSFKNHEQEMVNLINKSTLFLHCKIIWSLMITQLKIYFDNSFLDVFLDCQFHMPSSFENLNSRYLDALVVFSKNSGFDTYFDLMIDKPIHGQGQYHIVVIRNKMEFEEPFLSRISEFTRQIRSIVHFRRKLPID